MGNARNLRDETKENRKPAKNDPDAKPSQFEGAYWIYACRQEGTYPHRAENSGKWLVFVPIEKIDSVWETIKLATEQGLLGNSSKVSTAL